MPHGAAAARRRSTPTRARATSIFPAQHITAPLQPRDSTSPRTIGAPARRATAPAQEQRRRRTRSCRSRHAVRRLPLDGPLEPLGGQGRATTRPGSARSATWATRPATATRRRAGDAAREPGLQPQGARRPEHRLRAVPRRRRAARAGHARPAAAHEGLLQVPPDARLGVARRRQERVRRPATSGGDRGGPPTRIKTMFASGTLKPPRWLHNAEHTPDFIDRHKQVAARRLAVLLQLPQRGLLHRLPRRSRPPAEHPPERLPEHAPRRGADGDRRSARAATSEQSFCLDCHLRVGVAESSPANAKDSGRFHPPKSIWSDPPRKPGHHGFEAERNLNACVSCHTERDCVVCHGALGVGGGFNPHKNGFAGRLRDAVPQKPAPLLRLPRADSSGVLAPMSVRTAGSKESVARPCETALRPSGAGGYAICLTPHVVTAWQ